MATENGTSILFTGHNLIGRLEYDIVRIEERLQEIDNAYLDAASVVYHKRRNRWYARLVGYNPTFNFRNILGSMSPLEDRPHAGCIDAYHQYVWEREDPVKALRIARRLLQEASTFPNYSFNVTLKDLQMIEDAINGNPQVSS